MACKQAKYEGSQKTVAHRIENSLGSKNSHRACVNKPVPSAHACKMAAPAPTQIVPAVAEPELRPCSDSLIVNRLKAQPHMKNSVKNINTVEETAHRQAYALGRAYNTRKGVQKSYKLMVDNGNTTSLGVVVNEEFMRQMNLGYATLGQGTVPTAARSQGMTNLGVSENFSLRINGLKKVYSVKALVCRELSDPINIGTGFLQHMSNEKMSEARKRQEKSQNPTLTFYKDGVTLTRGDKSIPLVQTLREEQEKQEGGSSKEPEDTHKDVEDISKEPEDSAPTLTRCSRASTRQSTCVNRSRQAQSHVNGMPLYTKEDLMIKGNHLAFIKVARISATALVEPTGIKGYPSVEVVPAVYQGQDRI